MNSDSLFIGGTNYVLQIDLKNGHVLEVGYMSISTPRSPELKMCKSYYATLPNDNHKCFLLSVLTARRYHIVSNRWTGIAPFVK